MRVNSLRFIVVSLAGRLIRLPPWPVSAPVDLLRALEWAAHPRAALYHLPYIVPPTVRNIRRESSAGNLCPVRLRLGARFCVPLALPVLNTGGASGTRGPKPSLAIVAASR